MEIPSLSEGRHWKDVAGTPSRMRRFRLGSYVATACIVSLVYL